MNDSNSVQHKEGKNIKSISIFLRVFVIVLILIFLIAVGILMKLNRKSNDNTEISEEKSKVANNKVTNSNEITLTDYYKYSSEEEKKLRVYVTDETSDKELKKLENKIQMIDGVESVTIYTKEDALEDFRSRLENSQNILDDYDGDNNIFPDAIVVKITDFHKTQEIQDEIYKIQIDGKKCVEEIKTLN